MRIFGEIFLGIFRALKPVTDAVRTGATNIYKGHRDIAEKPHITLENPQLH
jgi:hypothetical protein